MDRSRSSFRAEKDRSTTPRRSWPEDADDDASDEGRLIHLGRMALSALVPLTSVVAAWHTFTALSVSVLIQMAIQASGAAPTTTCRISSAHRWVENSPRNLLDSFSGRRQFFPQESNFVLSFWPLVGEFFKPGSTPTLHFDGLDRNLKVSIRIAARPRASRGKWPRGTISSCCGSINLHHITASTTDNALHDPQILIGPSRRQGQGQGQGSLVPPASSRVIDDLDRHKSITSLTSLASPARHRLSN
jgi:hypothetical protein